MRPARSDKSQLVGVFLFCCRLATETMAPFIPPPWRAKRSRSASPKRRCMVIAQCNVRPMPARARAAAGVGSPNAYLKAVAVLFFSLPLGRVSTSFLSPSAHAGPGALIFGLTNSRSRIYVFRRNGFLGWGVRAFFSAGSYVNVSARRPSNVAVAQGNSNPSSRAFLLISVRQNRLLRPDT